MPSWDRECHDYVQSIAVLRPSTESTQSHRHDHADETLERLEHARTDLVLQLEKHFVLRECPERIHQKNRIERNLQIRPAVPNRHRFVRLAEVGTLRRELQEIARKFDL